MHTLALPCVDFVHSEKSIRRCRLGPSKSFYKSSTKALRSVARIRDVAFAFTHECYFQRAVAPSRAARVTSFYEHIWRAGSRIEISNHTSEIKLFSKIVSCYSHHSSLIRLLTETITLDFRSPSYHRKSTLRATGEECCHDACHRPLYLTPCYMFLPTLLQGSISLGCLA